jgi:hypothetical protein
MGSETTIRIEGENAFLTVSDCDYNVCPEGDVSLLIPIGVPGDSGLVTLAQFTALANLYNAALLPFLTNEDAFNALGAGKEFIFAQGSTEAPQGVKAITYTP